MTSDRREVVVRAPGRVNLIGEHTDYSLLAVMPVATEQALVVRARRRDDGEVRAVSRAADVGGRALVSWLDRTWAGARWVRYLAGAVAEFGLQPARWGADLDIEGDLPTGGGLSSSSALTVGITAALAAIWDVELGADELVEQALRAESAVGAGTGAMDQTVIVHARAEHALRVDFRPPARRHIKIPEGIAIVAAFSGETAAKGFESRGAYNDRVVGCRLAAALLVEATGVSAERAPVLAMVADVPGIAELAETLPGLASVADVAALTNSPLEAFTDDLGQMVDSARLYPLRAFAHHVLSEAARVDLAESALLAGDGPELGALFDASQSSLADDFACSTTGLDQLCAAMRAAGAWGARLTGAGFGGFAVAVAAPEVAEEVVAAAQKATGGPAFVVRPGPGLTVDGVLLSEAKS